MKHTVLAIGECYFCCWRGFFGLLKRLLFNLSFILKILFSNIFKLMRLNFFLSYMSSPHQTPRMFDNYSIIPSDLVFSLKLLYQLQIFVIVLWFIWQTREDIIISYLTLEQLHVFTKKENRLRKKNTSLYIITVLSYFLLWSKMRHRQQW